MEAEWRSAEEVAAVFWLALALVKDCLTVLIIDFFIVKENPLHSYLVNDNRDTTVEIYLT